MPYRVLVPGWLDRGENIPQGEVVEDWRLKDIPNLDALVEEGVLARETDDTPAEEPKARSRAKARG